MCSEYPTNQEVELESCMTCLDDILTVSIKRLKNSQISYSSILCLRIHLKLTVLKVHKIS